MNMNELKLIESIEEFIPIYETDKGEKVVSGEELYKGLGVSLKTQTSDWIKSQLEKVDATNKDFFVLKRESTGGRPSIDYILKLETAKEICLVAGASNRANPELKKKSKEYRRYLIQFEERYKNQLPQRTDEQLKAQLLLEIYNGGQSGILASKQLTELEKKPLLEKIEEDKPKIDVYERFINSEFTYTATALKGIFGFSSAVAMNKKLHELKLIYKPGNSKKWSAYKDTPKEWYKVLATEFGDTLRWTPKGILGIADLLDIKISEGDIENLIEKDDKNN